MRAYVRARDYLPDEQRVYFLLVFNLIVADLRVNGGRVFW